MSSRTVSRSGTSPAGRLAAGSCLALLLLINPPARGRDEGAPPAAADGEPGAGGISWLIPAEGGTPRVASRIERVGPTEFRIRASFEEDGASVLRHAVSRVELICSNGGARPAQVT